MNRVKRELRKKGIRLESDYPYLPYFIKGNSIFEPGYIFIDGVSVNSETATVKVYLNTITQIIKLQRDGSLEDDFE